MIELEALEIAVLEKLIFDERFENILADCKELAKPSIIEDVLKYLIQYKLVMSRYAEGGKPSKPGFMYDSDHMHDYTYQISAKGLKCLMEKKK